jgi:outer membrane receptor protein involved in Fe transport
MGMEVSFRNFGAVEAKGGEWGVEAVLSPHSQLFANYSYETWSDSSHSSFHSGATPRHKGNIGVHLRGGGAGLGIWAHAVGRQRWPEQDDARTLPGYVMVNAHLGYEFNGRARGWEIAVDGFNIGGRRHAELLTPGDDGSSGLNGERIADRITATVTYRYR